MKNILTILVLFIFCNLFAIIVSGKNFINSPFYIAMLISFLVHFAMFIPSNLLKTEKYYDITGTFAFISIILYTLLSKADNLNFRAYVLFIIIMIWTLRLGIFLFYRIIKIGEDKRFFHLKKTTLSFLVPWTMSAMWVFISSSPALIAIVSNNMDCDIFLIIGLCFWIFGFSFESIADYQKIKFNSDLNNKDKFINNGLWSISRHPNYFGEIILWIGVSIISFPTLLGYQYLTLISPFFIYLLLTRVSGINLLEKKSDIKWAKDPKYHDYKKSTSVLIPFINIDKI